MIDRLAGQALPALRVGDGRGRIGASREVPASTAVSLGSGLGLTRSMYTRGWHPQLQRSRHHVQPIRTPCFTVQGSDQCQCYWTVRIKRPRTTDRRPQDLCFPDRRESAVTLSVSCSFSLRTPPIIRGEATGTGSGLRYGRIQETVHWDPSPRDRCLVPPQLDPTGHMGGAGRTQHHVEIDSDSLVSQLLLNPARPRRKYTVSPATARVYTRRQSTPYRVGATRLGSETLHTVAQCNAVLCTPKSVCSRFVPVQFAQRIVRAPDITEGDLRPFRHS